MSIERLKQLKFIANIFNMSLKEIQDTLGFETLTMIFRRVGEAAAENIVKRLKGRYNSIEEFGNLIIKNVIEPVLGQGEGSISVSDKTITLVLNECPYKKSGRFPIKDMAFFCHYTEGLFDQAFKLAFPENTVFTQPGGLISSGECKNCTFNIEID